MRVEHRFFAADGLRLHTLDHGGSGRPIVLLHDVGASAWTWRDVAAPLSLWGRVIAVDLRGHGDSQWSGDRRYGTNDLADDLWRIVQAISDEPVDLVGHGWGALVGLRVAAGAPDLVRRLVLVDTPPSFDDALPTAPATPYAFPDHATAVAWERRAHPRASESLLEHMVAHATRPAAGGGIARKHDPFFADTVPFRDDSSWNDLRCVGVPTLLVRAQQSGVLAAATFAEMSDALPTAHRCTVPDSGHDIPLDNPLALVDALGDFFHEEELASGGRAVGVAAS